MLLFSRNVVGCENYYSRSQRHRVAPPPPVAQVVRPSVLREEPRSSSSSLAGGEFSGFLAQLEKHGLLKPGALDALKNVMLEQEMQEEEEEKERMVGSPTGQRLSLKSLSLQRGAASQSTSSNSDQEQGLPLNRNTLFQRRPPPKRRNKFTGFIPKVRAVGNTENIHPTGLTQEDIVEEAKDAINVIPSDSPMEAALAELDHSDNEMLKTIVSAILSEESSSTTAPSSTQSLSGGRKRTRGGSLFNPEGRRANNIFNRPRNRPRTRLRATTTTTTQASSEVEENLVEEEERPGPRLRGFRRPNRFRSQAGSGGRIRQPARFRPQEAVEDKEALEAMMKALGEGSELKAEFEKFMEEQLGTGPSRWVGRQ